MSRYTDGPWLAPIDGEDGEWEVTNDTFAYEVGEIGSGMEVVVPAGSTTDLASVPGIGRLFVKTHGLHTPAAVLHDCLYRGTAMVFLHKKLLPWPGKQFADTLFLEAMGVSGTPAFRAKYMYLAVKWFGRPSVDDYVIR